MAEMALYGRVDGLFEPRSVRAAEFSKANAGKLIIADILQEPRTALQNRFLNGWVYTIQLCGKLNDAGITNPVGGIWIRDQMHAFMQESFLLKQEFLLNGRHVKIFESTAKMSRKRFTRYIDAQIRQLASSMWQIEIDNPKEGLFLEIYNEIFSR